MSSEFDRPFIPLISDYGFKAVFGSEQRDSLFVRRALQALIESDTPIAKITFLPTEIGGLTIGSRGGVYDIACTDEHGRHFIVEMQLSPFPAFFQRMKFYTLYRLNTLVLRGAYKFENLPQIYCVGILAHTLFPDIADYHNVAMLRNHAGQLMDDRTIFITVELSKFVKPLSAVASDLDKLLYTMKTLHEAPENRQDWPVFWNEDWLRSALDELDKRNMSPEELLLYHTTLAREAHMVNVARQMKEEATRKGLEQGLEQGLEKGIEQGLEKGLQQGTLATQKATVKKLLAMHIMTDKQIADAAGVTLEFVQQLKADQL